MKKVALKDGFTLELDEGVLDDVELLDILLDIEGSDALAFPKALRKILGDQKEALFSHLKDENGRIPMAKMSEAFKEIMEGFVPKK